MNPEKCLRIIDEEGGGLFFLKPKKSPKEKGQLLYQQNLIYLSTTLLSSYSSPQEVLKFQRSRIYSRLMNYLWKKNKEFDINCAFKNFLTGMYLEYFLMLKWPFQQMAFLINNLLQNCNFALFCFNN